MLVLLVAAPLQTTWFVDASAPGPGTGTAGDPYARVDYALAQPSTVSGDTVMVAPGNYLDEAIDFLGKEVEVASSGGAAATTLVGIPSTSQFAAPTVRFASGEGPGARLRGFTIVGGGGEERDVPDFSCLFVGGGVMAFNADPTLEDLVILGGDGVNLGAGVYVEGGTVVGSNLTFDDTGEWTYSISGGGLFATGATVVLSDSLFEDTYADFRGGAAAFRNCTAQIVGTEFRSCTGEYVGGGALSVRDSDVIVSGCDFLQNRSGDPGGAVRAEGTGSLDVRDSYFGSNLAYSVDPYSGGAISSSIDVLRITDCRFVDNVGQWGGAVESNGPDCVIDGCEFIANRADGGFQYSSSGGAIDCQSGTVVRRSTFVDNEATDAYSNGGGAIRGPAVVDFCTFVGNTALAGEASAIAGVSAVTPATVSNSIVVTSTPSEPTVLSANVTWSLVEGGAPGNGNFDADPLFRDPASDLRLLPGSPAIDTGDPMSPLDADGTRADIGAFPFDPFAGDRIDLPVCVGNPNSTGSSAGLEAYGSADVSDNLVTLAVTDSPSGSLGYFLASRTSGFQMLGGGSQGALCMGGSILRFSNTVLDDRGSGVVAFRADLTDFPQSTTVMSGETWIFQYWFRDANPQPTSNTSGAARVDFL